ncbi:oxygen-insensitive NADPH nitroreductase [Acidithiobacillus montserratensis]|uniref:Oxygen-insensitive NADPH nitroreductase n=1 Tax=Acidithiobacillus montserratensis TaxID=2729135 RepID=A0ACD5HET9_9PROT|nr:oxygen-insensitive NADPH nitroreductase [Acidithiobacillus montserratensis]MBN2679099.1 oxygen-insensitive NADPH nitroreductase [Acidithiobacillaceae bacterium]MBU2747000.1 oxygen-insensitive NADPH nitroreductase [Acidithiobacillus montserratensis]
MTDVLPLLQSHRSIRQFRSDPLPEGLLENIVRCGQQASSSSNLQAYRIIQITDQDLRKQLSTLAGQQAYVLEAPVFLVFCADLRRAQEVCDEVGPPFVAGMTEHFLIATVDTALCAQNCTVAAESQGLGACYIGAVRNHPAEISTLLGLPQQVYPLFGLCLGYPAQEVEVKPRLPLAAVLQENRFDENRDAALIAQYDHTMKAYYQTRSTGQKTSSWSQEVASLAGREARPHMAEFLRQKGFLQR